MAGADGFAIAPNTVQQAYRAAWDLMVPDDEARARRELDMLTTLDLVGLAEALGREVLLIAEIIEQRMETT